MTPETLEALKASIATWERNAVAETPDDYCMGSENFPLCDMFIGANCIGCPVLDRTGKTGCHGTPYYRADEAQNDWLDGTCYAEDGKAEAERQHALHCAAEEVAFLKSLLPPEEQVP